MLSFPNAKINLGLNVLRKREDGYHDIESVFYPVKLFDVLEIVPAQTTSFHQYGAKIAGRPEDNLCMKVFNLVKERCSFGEASIHLLKAIPSGAGLGGGSSDAATMLKLLNKEFELNLKEEEMFELLLKIGSDCPFFLKNKPCFVSGKGEQMQEIDLDLSNLYIWLLKPEKGVSTVNAYSRITPQLPNESLRDIVTQKPIDNWKDLLVNDFEKHVTKEVPELGDYKRFLYDEGALYASMTGSGSAVYGLFKKEVPQTKKAPKGAFSWKGKM